jgi:hypothetical protein
MPQTVFDPYVAAAFNRLAAIANALRGSALSAETLRLADLGWLWLVPPLLVLRYLIRRPVLFAFVLFITIEAGSAATVARTYTVQVERLFGKLADATRP